MGVVSGNSIPGHAHPSLSKVLSGKVGSGDDGKPEPYDVESDRAPPVEGRDENRADPASLENAETQELTRLRKLTQELSDNISDLAGLGERDPEELERLLGNTLQYLSARQAALPEATGAQSSKAHLVSIGAGNQHLSFL